MYNYNIMYTYTIEMCIIIIATCTWTLQWL